ncbi:MAG TPA: hypothetical protein VK943_05100 [Arenibaculum sp.]|nr:hypothetical protein [Arenibaculum sp.]
MDQTGGTGTDSGDDASSGALMRGLKIALVLMGVFIVLGFAAVGYEIYRRNTDPEYRASRMAEQESVTISVPSRTPGTPLLLPPGAIITDTVAVGRQLAVTVEQLDGTQTLYFVDPADNAFTEFLRTQPAPRR